LKLEIQNVAVVLLKGLILKKLIQSRTRIEVFLLLKNVCEFHFVMTDLGVQNVWSYEGELMILLHVEQSTLTCIPNCY
jgi:hypothetical protein